MAEPINLTEPQKKMLREAGEYRLDEGRHSWGTRGFRRAGKERMAKKLVDAGLLSEYIHGGFDITPKGSCVLDAIGRQS